MAIDLTSVLSGHPIIRLTRFTETMIAYCKTHRKEGEGQDDR